MPAGTVKWFNAEKGFGFISPNDGGPDVHVEAAVLGSTGWFLEENQSVYYDVTDGPRGPQVTGVTAM
ncbi:cold-shock protein [Streptomyces sp. NPDC048462]|uniref:cold-shock protein n=1 Tax=Streptomyces sp. NPDC048462 TaxID=3365555 RepID=UPI0037246173